MKVRDIGRRKINLCNLVARFQSAEGNFNFEEAENNWNHSRVTKFGDILIT